MHRLDQLRSSPRAAWLISFLLVTAIGSAWSLATPPYGVIDEPNHVIKALSVSRGEWTGDPVPADEAPQDHLYRSGWAAFDIPEIYDDAAESAGCFRGQPAETPDCMSFTGPTEDARILEPDSRYPPPYYLAVGLIERVWHAGPGAILLMRLVNTVIAAALVASAAVSLLRLRGAPVALMGLAVAATPMTFHLAGAVNPSGPEIAAGMALWASGAVLAHEAAERIDHRLVMRVAAAAAVLALCRPLSPLFVAVIGAFVLALFTRAGLRALVRDRAVQVGAAVVAGAAAFQLGWVAIVKPNYFGAPLGPEVTNSDIIRAIIGKAPDLYRQMVGVFGSPDMYTPEPVILLWSLMLGGLAFAALAAGRRRVVAVCGVTLVATIAIPMVADYLQARSLTFPWQARYTMPIAAGIPLLLGTALATGDHVRLFRRPLLLGTLGTALVIGQVTTFAAVLRRYTVGRDGAVLFWAQSRWAPPLPVLVLLGGAALAIIGWVVWLLAAPRPPGQRAAHQGPPGEHAATGETTTPTAAAAGTR